MKKKNELFLPSPGYMELIRILVPEIKPGKLLRVFITNINNPFSGMGGVYTDSKLWKLSRVTNPSANIISILRPNSLWVFLFFGTTFCVCISVPVCVCVCVNQHPFSINKRIKAFSANLKFLHYLLCRCVCVCGACVSLHVMDFIRKRGGISL